MAVPTQMRFLTNARINRIVGELAPVLEMERPLLYLDRLPLVDAQDDEIVGRFSGRVITADIIADDQKAMVQESMSLELLTHTIPNIKRGERLGQRLLNRLRSLENAPVQGEDALTDWESRLTDLLVLGVRQRMNAMACGMMLDTFSYDRFGIKVSNATWGTPADLKVVVGTVWSNVASTPITDILTLRQHAEDVYGIVFNRLTMTPTDFDNMTKTTEFRSMANVYMSPQPAFILGAGMLTTVDRKRMLTLAGQILGMEVEIDFATTNERTNAGKLVTKRVLPNGSVLMSRTEDDNNGSTWDMANAVVTEAIVAEMSDMTFGDLGGDMYGPVAYYTPAAHDVNPPGVVAWAVARAFPRKYVPEASAVLTVA